MTTAPRQRFSTRAGLADAFSDGAPYEGVPSHLRQPLTAWLHAQLGRGEYREQPDHGLAMVLSLRLRIDPSPYSSSLDRLLGAEGAELLDVIDALLAYRADQRQSENSRNAAHVLGVLLTEGGSAYRVADDLSGLEMRVATAVRGAVQQTVSDAASSLPAGSAADHLAAAWAAAYGLHPDPVRAYSEAIKAAESAAHAVVEPNNAKATLGTMIRVIRNSPSRFTTALFSPAGKDPVVPLEAMMRALWEGQTSRHGAQTGTVPETPEAAQSAVHLAATLVQWFTSGAVVRTP
jgi:hypothetical protein